jgi:hypothetical protein
MNFHQYPFDVLAGHCLLIGFAPPFTTQNKRADGLFHQPFLRR